MKVYFATDHAGFELKEALLAFVVHELEYEVEDCGAHEFVAEDDYPDYVAKAARAVSSDPTGARAVVLGGSGQGEAIVANRFPGVRAVVFYGAGEREGEKEPPSVVEVARAHNDANVLSLGARFVTLAEAKDAVRAFLETPFSGAPRHVRRIEKIDQYP